MKGVVLFIGHDATRTGAPKSLLNIVRWMSSNTELIPVVLLGRGGPLFEDYAAVCEAYVWDPTPGTLESRTCVPGVAGATVNLARAARQHRLAGVLHRRFLRRRLEHLNPACVFNNTGVNGRLLGYFSPNLSAPIVSRIPELEAFMRRNAAGGGLQRVLALSQHFVAVSEAVRVNLQQRYGIAAERISIVYGACEPRPQLPRDLALRRQLGIAECELMVCGCGTMDWRKGFDLFLQTAHEMVGQRQRTDIKFVWIGGAISPETEVEYRYEIESLGLEAHLVLPGELPDPSLLFACADLFFLSSREDPFPLVMLEAARQGLPIVCFAGSGGAAEFVKPAFGTVVPRLAVSAAASAISELLARPDFDRVREAARSEAGRYTIDRMGSEAAQVVCKLIDGAG